MNTDKLAEITSHIVHSEKVLDTKTTLENLARSLAELANQPQAPEYQKSVSENLVLFRNAAADFERSFTPQDYERVLELDPDTFSRDFPKEISEKISENAMTPAVASEFVQSAAKSRSTALEHLNDLSNILGHFGLGHAKLLEGTTEVGFQIPRELFDNEYSGFLSELKQIQRMLRFFSELATGESQTIQVGSISTTDPLMFLGMAKEVALVFSGSVTWGIGVWYSVEKIRKVRAETAQIEVFTAKEIDEIFGKKIKDTIDLEVDKKVTSLLAEGKADKSQHGELKGHLTWALNALLAKIERGLTIELRLEPPEEPENEEDEFDEAEVAVFEQLSNIQEKLVFPDRNDNPVLSIPKFEGNDEEGQGKA